MGLLDKLKFWKHEEGFELGKYPALEQPPGTEVQSMAPPSAAGLTEAPAETPQVFGPQQQFEDLGPAPPPPMTGIGRGQLSVAPLRESFSPIVSPSAPAPQYPTGDMQVVNAKLDTLKALLDNIAAKLDRLERSQQKEEVEVIPLQRRWR